MKATPAVPKSPLITVPLGHVPEVVKLPYGTVNGLPGKLAAPALWMSAPEKTSLVWSPPKPAGYGAVYRSRPGLETQSGYRCMT